MLNYVTTALLFFQCHSHSQPDTRIQWLISAVQRSLDQVNANQCGSEAKHPCSGRDFSNAAVSSYILSLQTVNNMTVNMTVNTTGTMHWLSKVQPDASFVGQGFCALAHEPTFMNALNATSKQYVLDSIAKALPSLSIWNAIDVSYSNMFFMGMVNAIICGEVPGIVNTTAATKAANHGYLLLENWLTYAANAGNHEFDSPTYYWVQFNALGLGCMYARNTTRRAQLCGILEHLWADVALNYFFPTETLSGPHSRDYDFLYGHGALQVLTYINGLGQHPPICEFHDAHCERTDDGQNALVLLHALHGYKPKASTLRLATIPTRTVQSRFLGQNRTANNLTARMGDRYNYIRSGVYAMGSVSQDYITNTHHPYMPCPQDKLISIDLAMSNMTQYKPNPSITLVHDWLDHPWGHLWKGNPTDKPSHLAPHPGNVQHQNMLLATSALNPSEKLDGFNIDSFQSLATNVILPSRVDSYFVYGDEKVRRPPTAGNFSRTLHTGNINSSTGNNSREVTIGIRMENACLAIRVVTNDGVGGYTPSAMLKGDTVGLSLHAWRLVLYHYQGKNSTLEGNTHVANAFVMVVEECQDESTDQDLDRDRDREDRDKKGSGSGDAQLIALVKEVSENVTIEQERGGGGGGGGDSEDTDSTVWRLKAIVRGTALEVTRNVREPHCASWECVLSRTINGTAVLPVPLQVNGVVQVPLPRP